MKTTFNISPAEFFKFGFIQIPECDNPSNNEFTLQKIVSEKEVYSIVVWTDVSMLIICVHEMNLKSTSNIERLFKGKCSSVSCLEIILNCLQIPNLK
jgi:hypothetical protein